MKTLIQQLIQTQLNTLIENQTFAPDALQTPWQIERTRQPEHGHFACNVAMILGKSLKIAPRGLAEKILNDFPSHPAIANIEIAGPGFLNFFLTPHAQNQIILDILTQKDEFGKNRGGAGKSILLEYVSANPTGPLHVGHGRAAAYGSALGHILKANGFHVHSEYYVNDAGRQMDILAASVFLRYLNLAGEWIVFPPNAYQGDYITHIAQNFLNIHQQSFCIDTADLFVNLTPHDNNMSDYEKEKQMDILIDRIKTALSEQYEILQPFALQYILQGIQQDLTDFGVHHDEWFSEKSLLENPKFLINMFNALREKNYLYEKEGATWFRATEFGDDKDRVVIRENGQSTYFASDIAYHVNKFNRGFHRLIDVLGSDHHGYVTRVKASMAALGYKPEAIEVLLVQFATLWRGKERLSMSTRSGSFVTLRELYQETGVDAARFFYLSRKNEQHLDFDLELAKQQNNDNPVYYLQYAHARICSVFRQCDEKGFDKTLSEDLNALTQLTQPCEQALIAELSQYSESVESAARMFEPHLIILFLKDLAQAFHAYYNNEAFLVDDALLRQARLTLIAATQQVLFNGLSLLGISAPEKM
jgi:arginyl-tRNA synthetase